MTHSEHWKNERVEQEDWAECREPILFSTEGLGNCIGVCIAWNGWAGILHSSYIPFAEEDLVAPLIAAAKAVIPPEVVPHIHPVVCGGDTADPHDMSHDPEASVREVLEARERILVLLAEAGFGEPHVRWNEYGETTSLVADLKDHFICVENVDGELKRWDISTENPPRKRRA